MVADDDGGATRKYRTQHACCAATKETRERNRTTTASAVFVRAWVLGFRPTSSPNIPEGPTHHVIGFKNLKSLGSLRKCKSEWGIENGNL